MKKYLIPAALLLGFSFDLLFWGKIPGISFFAFVLLCLAFGFFLIKTDHLNPAKASVLLIIPILFLSFMVFIRKEPFTSFLNISLTLFFMAALAMTYLGGQWLSFGLGDYVANFFHFVGGLVSLPLLENQSKESHQEQSGFKAWLKNAQPVIRGVLLAIPVLLLFTALFSSADLIFAKRVSALFANLKLENLPEYLLRGVIILIIAYCFTGIILYAANRSKDLHLLGKEKPILPPFLGFHRNVHRFGWRLAPLHRFRAGSISVFFLWPGKHHSAGVYLFGICAPRIWGACCGRAFQHCADQRAWRDFKMRY